MVLLVRIATATYIGQIFFGPHPSFVIPRFETPYFHIDNPLLLLSYAGLGIILGLTSAVYIRSIYVFEDFFDERIKGKPYVRHMLGMLLIGIIIYLLMDIFGHYYIEGVGYATIRPETVRHIRYLGFGCIGRDFLTFALFGRHPRRSIRGGLAPDLSGIADRSSGIRCRGNGGSCRGSNGGSHGSHRDDIRDDS